MPLPSLEDIEKNLKEKGEDWVMNRGFYTSNKKTGARTRYLEYREKGTNRRRYAHIDVNKLEIRTTRSFKQDQQFFINTFNRKQVDKIAKREERNIAMRKGIKVTELKKADRKLARTKAQELHKAKQAEIKAGRIKFIQEQKGVGKRQAYNIYNKILKSKSTYWFKKRTGKV